MITPMDMETCWPDLFDRLSDSQREMAMESFVAMWHEGWQPNREDVADLTDYARGAVSADEFTALSAAKAARLAGHVGGRS